ncbi:hypothetical protein [Streptomyces mayteni]
MEFWVGTAIAVASFALAGVALAWQKRGGTFKRIHYTAYREQLLMDRSEGAFDDFSAGPISVHLEPGGHELVWPMAFKLKLANTGRAPITPDDFSAPISITFGNLCRFVGGAIEVNRGAVEEFVQSDSLELSGGILKISPFLLNPGDQITLSGILNGIPAEEGITISGRIAGVETFARLAPEDGGITMKLLGRSLIYDSMESWPSNPALDIKVVVLPKFLPLDEIAPSGADGRGISTRVNGTAVEHMHQTSFIIRNNSQREIHITSPLTFGDEADSFLHLIRATRNDSPIPESELGRIVHHDSGQVRIRVGRLGVDEFLALSFITEGDVSNLKLLERPPATEDVQIMRARVTDDPLGKKLLDMDPRILLVSRRFHRKFHLEMPHAKALIRRIREARQRILHGD